MDYRYLGRSGLKISELTYGNWITHGSQVENDTATECVRAALDVGITSFDTADAYANTVAEEVLGAALEGQRRESLEIFTKVYWPTGPKGANDSGLSRKHIMESINGSLRRLRTDYVDLYQAHRYDTETPLGETMLAFADVVRAGKALYIGVSEWTAEQIRAGHALATELGVHLVSNQPQYSMLWRTIEPEVIPASRELGLSQIVFSPLAQGVLTGKYLPARPRRRARGPPTTRAAPPSSPDTPATRTSWPGCRTSSRSPRTPGSPWPSSAWPGCWPTTTWPRPSSGVPAGADQGERGRHRRHARAGAAVPDRRRAR